MIRGLTTIPWLSGLLLCMSQAHGVEFTVFGTVTSEYIYRGLEFSDGDPALQAGVDIHGDGWFAGAWATSLDIVSRGGTGRRDRELDLYAGYRFAKPDRRWSGALALVRYTFPGATGSHDYDYTEWLASLGAGERWTLEFAFTNDYQGSSRVARNLELTGSWPLGSRWTVGGAIGWADVPFWADADYWHGHFGVSATLGPATLDLRLYDNSTPNSVFRSVAAGSQWVVSISAGF